MSRAVRAVWALRDSYYSRQRILNTLHAFQLPGRIPPTCSISAWSPEQLSNRKHLILAWDGEKPSKMQSQEKCNEQIWRRLLGKWKKMDTELLQKTLLASQTIYAWRCVKIRLPEEALAFCPASCKCFYSGRLTNGGCKNRDSGLRSWINRFCPSLKKKRRNYASKTFVADIIQNKRSDFLNYPASNLTRGK